MSLLRLLVLLALGGCVAVQPKNNLVNEAEVAERATALGVAYLQQGDLERAKENLLKALSVDKRSARPHHTLAIVFQQEQEFDLVADAERGDL